MKTQILDEDSKISDSILTISSRLKNVQSYFKQAIAEEELNIKSEKSQNISVTDELQQLLESQMKTQRDILESQVARPKHTNNVKLPKLEIQSFSGDKLR